MGLALEVRYRRMIRIDYITGRRTIVRASGKPLSLLDYFKHINEVNNEAPHLGYVYLAEYSELEELAHTLKQNEQPC
jgi:hypothetical protein